MRLTSIASGSSGNCIYVGSENTHLLIDSGVSGKRIEQGLSSLSVSPEDLSGILVTHEHTDHIQGLGVMARRYHLPVYMTEKTGQCILETQNLGNLDPGLFQYITPEQEFKVGDLAVDAHAIWHDAADPVCYTVRDGDTKASIVTDLGDYSDELVDSLRDCSILFIEANHDQRMLEAGPYPYPLKQRIMGRYGHLSNDSCGTCIRELTGDRLQYVILGHLSKENNFPELAYETVRLSLGGGESSALEHIQLQVAYRDRVSPVAVAR